MTYITMTHDDTRWHTMTYDDLRWLAMTCDDLRASSAILSLYQWRDVTLQMSYKHVMCQSFVDFYS